MKVSQFDTSNLNQADFMVFVSKMLNDVKSILNGGLLVQDNCSFKVADVQFTAANSEVKINHSLGRLPLGYILIGASAAMSLYNGVTASSVQDIYVRSSATGSATILVI